MIENGIKNIIKKYNANVSVILHDMDKNCEVVSEDKTRVVRSASIIKLLIMTEAFNRIHSGMLSLDDVIKIKESDKVPYSMITEMHTDTYLLYDIIYLMITVSDNTAANVLIDMLTFDSINSTAKKLGLKNTILNRKMMDLEAQKACRDNYTTAEDTSRLMRLIYYRKIFDDRCCDIMMGILKEQKDRSMLGRNFPEDFIIAGKTGGLANLNHDIGIFYLQNVTYMLGVFVTNAEDNIVSKDVITNISDYVFRCYTSERNTK